MDAEGHGTALQRQHAAALRLEAALRELRELALTPAGWGMEEGPQAKLDILYTEAPDCAAKRIISKVRVCQAFSDMVLVECTCTMNATYRI